MRRATVFLQEEWETLEKRVHKIEEATLERAEVSKPLQDSIKRFRSAHGKLPAYQLYADLKSLDDFFTENAEGTSLDLILVYSSFSVTRIILNNIMKAVVHIWDSLKYWKSRQCSYTYLFEKTPQSWYHLLSNVNPTKPVIHPYKEIDTHIAKLETLEKQLVSHYARGAEFLNELIHFQDWKNIHRKLIPLINGHKKFMCQFYSNNQKAYVISSKFLYRVPYDFLKKKLRKPSKKVYKFESNHLPIMETCEYLDEIGLSDRRSLYQTIVESVLLLNQYNNTITSTIRIHGRPPYLYRNWLKLMVAGVTSFFVYRYLYTHQVDIFDYLKDAQITLSKFGSEYVKKPLLSIYETVRYNKSDVYVNLVDTDALAHDVESLARMVTQYTSEHKRLDEIGILNVRELAMKGDISPIMEDYEHAIKSPIKNAFIGELPRLMLIQVQKSKTDIEKALMAIDKLLKANELNFEVLAAIPAVVFTGAVYYQAYAFYNRTSRAMLARQNEIRDTLRNVEKILNKNSTNQVIPGEEYFKYQSYQLPFYELGHLLIAITHLKKLAVYLPNKYEYFMEDLKELESKHFDLTQRLRTVDRMYRTYPFLWAGK